MSRYAVPGGMPLTWGLSAAGSGKGEHMCEYCGCRALATIDELTREHDLVINLIGQARAAHAGADAAQMAELARQISTVLGRIPRWRSGGCSLP